MGTHAEFVEVGFSGQDRAGGEQGVDDCCVERGGVGFQDFGGGGCAEGRGCYVVFNGDCFALEGRGGDCDFCS